MISGNRARPFTRRLSPARRVAALALAAALAGGCAARAPDPLRPPATVTARDRATRSLQSDLATLFSAPALHRATVAVRVDSIDRGETLFRHNDERLVVPASNQKLLTLAAAAELLKWDYRFVTTLRPAGTVRDGLLEGDLAVAGSGDPTLSDRYEGAEPVFARWAAALRAAGITTISGRLLADERAFAGPPWGSGWPWDDLAFGYAAPVGALQAGDNVTSVTITAGPAPGSPAAVALADSRSGLVLDAHVTTTPAGTPVAVRFERFPGAATLRVSGSIPLGETAAGSVAVNDATTRFLTMLKEVFERYGIRVNGGVAAASDGPEMPPAPPLVEHTSPALREIAAVAMKTSHNLHAESLFRALAAGGSGEVPRDGAHAVTSVLQSWGIAADAVRVADGSGLSRYNAVTASALMTVLRTMADDERHRDEWLPLFPVGGREGTMASRFTSGPASGRVRAKTGTLAAVRALSGYVRTSMGELLAFVMIVNHPSGPRAEVDAVLDAAVERLAVFER